MTVGSTYSPATHTGNGAATTFDFNFRILDESHLVVRKYLVSTGEIVETLTLNTDYTVTGGDDDDGGSVVLEGAALEATHRIIISREVPYEQAADIINQGGFYPDVVEYQLDLMVMGMQQLDERADRAIVVPPGYTAGDLDPDEVEAGGFLGFDAGGAVTILSGTGTDAALRTDLAGNNGFTLIKYKGSETGTYGRTAMQLAAMGIGNVGINLGHFIDPDLDEDILAGTNVQSLTAFMEAAIDALPAENGLLVLPPRHLLFETGFTLDKNGMVVHAFGAELDGQLTGVSPLITKSGNDIAWHGGLITLPQGQPYGFSITGARSWIGGRMKLEKGTGVTGTVVIFWHPGATGSKLIGCEIISTHGTEIRCSDFTALGNTVTCPTAGGDDAFAIKGWQQSTTDIRIGFNKIRGHAAACSLGTQVGPLGVDDLDYDMHIKGVTVGHNNLEACGNIGLIKPGTLADHRHGLIEGIVFSNNTLLDPAGVKFDKGFTIIAANGQIVRDVKGRGNKVIARHHDATGARARVGGLWINTQVNGGASNEPRVEDIDIEMDYTDPYDGVANGVVVRGTAAPGYPVDQFALIEGASAGYGDIENIRISGKCRYTAKQGVVIGEGYNGAVTLDHLDMEFINVEASASNYGVYAASIVNVKRDVRIEMVSNLPYFQTATGGFIGEFVTLPIPDDIAAGTAAKRTCGVLPFRSVVVEWGLMADAVTRHATDFMTLTLKRYDYSGAALSTVDTQGTETVTGTEIVVDKYNVLNSASIIGANNLFDVRDTVVLDKADGGAGTGANLNNASLGLMVVPY